MRLACLAEHQASEASLQRKKEKERSSSTEAVVHKFQNITAWIIEERGKRRILRTQYSDRYSCAIQELSRIYEWLSYMRSRWYQVLRELWSYVLDIADRNFLRARFLRLKVQPIACNLHFVFVRAQIVSYTLLTNLSTKGMILQYFHVNLLVMSKNIINYM